MIPAAESVDDDRADTVDSRISSGVSLHPPSPHRLHLRARRENFPVASWVLPSRYRRHLLTLYAFARMVDDIGDAASGDRLAQLDAVSDELERVFAGAAPSAPLYQDLAHTVYACRLSPEPFDRLIEANRRDQVVQRYQTFEELLDYCAFSAEPVGRLVLAVFGVTDECSRLWSDRICSALQILEHCQDVAEDARAGRIYLPAEDLERFHVAEPDLLMPRARRSVRALVGFEVQRAVRLLDEGAPLAGALSGPARLAIAGYTAGGYATASALAAAGFDVFTSTPRPTRARTLFEFMNLLVSGSGR